MSTTWERAESIFGNLGDRVERTSVEVPDSESFLIRRGLLERLLAEAGYLPVPVTPAAT